MSLPVHPAAGRTAPLGPFSPSAADGAFRDPNHFNEVFLGAFRRDVLSFFPGARIDHEAILPLTEPRPNPARVSPTFALDFQLHEADEPRDSVRVSLFGAWYRLTVPRALGLGPRDRELLRAIGRVMELHHQVLFRWSGGSLLRLRRGMPEDHYVAACLEPSAYASPDSVPSRIAEAILTLRTMALSTYENRRVSTGALILAHDPGRDTGLLGSIREAAAQPLTFGVELTSLKTLHRLCDGRRTVFLVDPSRRLSGIVDIQRWSTQQASLDDGESPHTLPGDAHSAELRIPCARAYMFHALATSSGGHVCLVLSPNQEIKIFAGGVQAFVFAHGRWRVLDPESKYARWEQAVGNPRLARVLFQTALDLAEERQGGLLVVVDEPSQAIGRLIAPHDVLEQESPRSDDDADVEGPGVEAPAMPFTLFGLNTAHPRDDRVLVSAARLAGHVPTVEEPEPLTKRSLHYLARGLYVTAMDSSVLEALAGLDGALVTASDGRLLAMGAILRHDAHSLPGPDLHETAGATLPEGARTTAALVASHFGPVLKISEDGIVSCFLAGVRVWDL